MIKPTHVSSQPNPIGPGFTLKHVLGHENTGLEGVLLDLGDVVEAERKNNHQCGMTSFMREVLKTRVRIRSISLNIVL